MVESKLEFRELSSTRLSGDVVYRIYLDKIDSGDVFRREPDRKWSLSIPCASIYLTGENRYDLFEEAQIEYNKFIAGD
jgi:hypothetical protein